MTICKRWDIVKAPLAPGGAMRPALVIAAGEIFRAHGLLWGLMITSAKNRGWPGDIEIDDVLAAGLGVPSIIRTAKIVTVEGRHAEVIGALLAPQRPAVGARIFAQLGIQPAGIAA
jgi:mRNA interferase MazF